jgi:hypothetical protein
MNKYISALTKIKEPELLTIGIIIGLNLCFLFGILEFQLDRTFPSWLLAGVETGIFCLCMLLLQSYNGRKSAERNNATLELLKDMILKTREGNK